MNFNVFLLAIIAINILFSMKGFEDLAFFKKYQFHIGRIRAGEQIRMISSGFLHADIPHLAFNMIALYSFAPVLTHSLGNFSFILIYFGSLLFGSLLTLVLYKDVYNYSAVGASGAVTGIIYSAILLYPDLPINIFFIPIDIPGYLFGIIYLLFSIYGMKTKTDNIGHAAHFGGAIGGYSITLLKEPYLLQENTFISIALALPIVLLYIMIKQGKL